MAKIDCEENASMGSRCPFLLMLFLRSAHYDHFQYFPFPACLRSFSRRSTLALVVMASSDRPLLRRIIGKRETGRINSIFNYKLRDNTISSCYSNPRKQETSNSQERRTADHEELHHPCLSYVRTAGYLPARI